MSAAVASVTAMPHEEVPRVERDKMLDLALQQIEKQHGKGAVMRLGEHAGVNGVGVIPTGSLALDVALEIADLLVRSGAVDLVVIDSVAALVPRAEIEGEMGDSHVGLQARLMSQAMRKLAGSLSRFDTTALFINQLREKIGIMFGCFSYGTRVTLADGTQEKIGKIVNQKMPVEVLSYDPDLGKVVPKKVVNWFDNGRADHFLQFTVARGGGNG